MVGVMCQYFGIFLKRKEEREREMYYGCQNDIGIVVLFPLLGFYISLAALDVVICQLGNAVGWFTFWQ